ncbi:MAG: YopX family protein [Bacillota bacterium]|nr:YopX family protein [Bacillota bacterium]
MKKCKSCNKVINTLDLFKFNVCNKCCVKCFGVGRTRSYSGKKTDNKQLHYTGFKDENGLKIYNHDILFDNVLNIYLEVIWAKGEFRVCVIDDLDISFPDSAIPLQIYSYSDKQKRLQWLEKLGSLLDVKWQIAKKFGKL